jgi:hypothetical protein
MLKYEGDKLQQSALQQLHSHQQSRHPTKFFYSFTFAMLILLLAFRISSSHKIGNVDILRHCFGACVLTASLSTSGIIARVPIAIAVQGEVSTNDLSRLKKGLREVNYLLDNWEEKTTYCNFGEAQRDMMKTENKKELLKLAAETGLLDYDKSATMNIVCRRDPQVVRAFMGLTDDNLLLKRADILMKKPSTLDRIDPDLLDHYVEEVEKYSQAVATVDSIAYAARSDYASTETTIASAESAAKKVGGKSSKRALSFSSLEESSNDASSIATAKKDYLAQSKDAVVIARDALSGIVKDLDL